MSPTKESQPTQAEALTQDIDKDAIEQNIERTFNRKSFKLGELVTSAKDKLDLAHGYVDAAGDKSVGQGKEFVKALMEPAKALVSVLEMVQEIHPAVAVAVGVFKVVVQLGLDKHENDKRVAVLYYTMTDSLFALSYLDPVFKEDDSLQARLQDHLSTFCHTMNDFGNFCDLYYKHSGTVRLIMSGRYKGKLAEFASDFEEHKLSLQNLIIHRTAVTVEAVAIRLDQVSDNINAILSFLSSQSSKESEVAKMIDREGGEDIVLYDDLLLNQVTKNIGGEKLTLSAKYILRSDLGTLLESNMALYNMKIDAAVLQIEESVQRSTGAILSYLEAGAHDSIEDPDIRHIWKDMGWRHTVKARHFVESIQYYYAQIFAAHRKQAGEPHPDVWTLQFLSSVVFYPNIWDAIDKDGSGYLSVWEVNRFFRAKPDRLTSPEWMSYWAVGHYKNILHYRHQCSDLLDSIEEMCKKSRGSTRECLKTYMGVDTLGDLRLFVQSVWVDRLSWYGHDSKLDDSGPLENIRRLQREDDVAAIRPRLALTKYLIDSPSLVKGFTGTRQLESNILCMIGLVLQRHETIIKLTQSTLIADEEIHAMTTTVTSINLALDTRLHNLLESWRQQRMDCELQVECFAAGLFEDYWLTYYQNNDDINSESGSESDEESDFSEDIQWDVEKQHNVLSDPNESKDLSSLLIFPDLATKLPELGSRAMSPTSEWASESEEEEPEATEVTMETRMTALEAKMDNLTVLMTQLLAAATNMARKDSSSLEASNPETKGESQGEKVPTVTIEEC